MLNFECRTMRPNTLQFKIGISLAIALTLTMAIFIALVGKYHRAHILNAAIDHIAQLSETVTKSTRFAMLLNQPAYVHRIFEDVGSQEGIVKIRMMNKDGTIIHSTYPEETGLKVDKQAEACLNCHDGETPLSEIPRFKRARIFDSGNGSRLLGNMEVIRNEPSCYTASCHAHSKDQSVLGVLDIVYSLEHIDRQVWHNTLLFMGLAIGFGILASFVVGYFIRRMVYKPLCDLKSGAERLASGKLDKPIPVRSADEFGQVAISFNTMTTALRDSQIKLKEWGKKLEQKVKEKTKELKAAEVESVHQEKMASVGLLAAGIAHELNNPLTGVLTFSTLVRGNLKDGTQDAEDMDLVIRETNRCATIIRRLLDFAREKNPETKYADINSIINKTVYFLERPAYFSDVKISLELDSKLPQIWVDEDLIKQVIMNILINAQQAIEGTGSITIQTRAIHEFHKPEVKPGPVVEIAVSDTGCGISKQNLQRIFDPFFTSKEVGQGTGLGLSVSHGIVKAHGGTIEVDSEVDVGTTFHIYLPLTTDDTE